MSKPIKNMNLDELVEFCDEKMDLLEAQNNILDKLTENKESEDLVQILDSGDQPLI